MGEKHGTKFPELFADLTKDFDPRHVRKRKLNEGSKSKEISYISARTIMNRLDSVLGPENWTDTYFPVEGGVMCTLTITLPDGKQVSKTDVGPHGDDRNGDKGAFSGAFKRAAVKFGIGRHLYGEGQYKYKTQPAPESPKPRPPQPPRPEPEFRDGKVRPGEATFGGEVAPPIQGRVGEAINGLKAFANGSANGAGTAVLEAACTTDDLMAYLRELDPDSTNGIRTHLSNWGRRMGYGGLIKSWSNGQAASGYDELTSYLDARRED